MRDSLRIVITGSYVVYMRRDFVSADGSGVSLRLLDDQLIVAMWGPDEGTAQHEAKVVTYQGCCAETAREIMDGIAALLLDTGLVELPVG